MNPPVLAPASRQPATGRRQTGRLEGVQRPGELVSAAAGVPGVVEVVRDDDGHRGVDLGRRLGGETTGDAHPSGGDQLSGLLAGTGQTTPDEFRVQAPQAGHRSPLDVDETVREHTVHALEPGWLGVERPGDHLRQRGDHLVNDGITGHRRSRRLAGSTGLSVPTGLAGRNVRHLVNHVECLLRPYPPGPSPGKVALVTLPRPGGPRLDSL